MKNSKMESATEIAEGFPPKSSIPDDRVGLVEAKVRAKEPPFMEVFFAWEKMRLLYNALMGVLVICIVVKAGFGFSIGVWIAEGAVLANLCFCIGPIAEGYLCWLGLPHQTTRWVLFCWGCVISIFLTAESSHKFLIDN
jgi:hypothetical protein